MSAALEAIISAHVAAATAGLYRQIAELHNAHADLAAAHQDLKDRHERMFRPGTVASVDPNAHTYRHVLGLDENGNQILSPPRPYSQHAGQLKLHNPPSVGQQMLLISPDGDFEQGIGMPYGWSNANASPSTSGSTIAGIFAGISFSLNGSALALTANVTLTGNLTQTGNLSVSGNVGASGGTFQHNSHDVGATHKHTEITSGADQSGPPV